MKRRPKALVTGGTRGIGRATAVALQAAGYDVVVTGTTLQRRSPRGCGYLACDFANPHAVEALGTLVARMGLSVLVNNAGINVVGPVASYEPEEFLRIQQINVTAPFLLCRAVTPGMCQRRFGRIVNITSLYGVVSRAGRAAYSASKFGLFGFSRALALELAPYNVLVNCLAPGFVETDMTRQVLGAKGMAQMRVQIPIKRMAQPEEIARYVRFLASEDNSYLTGQQVVVDGGFTSG